jgi:hypothetical protein
MPHAKQHEDPGVERKPSPASCTRKPMSLTDSLQGVLPGWRPVHETSTVPVQVTSSPVGARILLGNRELGSTPAAVGVSTAQVLTVRREGVLDAFTRVSGPTLEVPLWRSEPEVQLVRPPVPGAVIRSADFLPDGRVALEIEVPPGGERRPWAYDPDTAHLLRLGNAPAPGALPSAVAVAPDGIYTAAITQLDGLDGAAADQFTLNGPEGPRQPLPNRRAATTSSREDPPASWRPPSRTQVPATPRDKRRPPIGRHGRTVGLRERRAT